MQGRFGGHEMRAGRWSCFERGMGVLVDGARDVRFCRREAEEQRGQRLILCGLKFQPMGLARGVNQCRLGIARMMQGWMRCLFVAEVVQSRLKTGAPSTELRCTLEVILALRQIRTADGVE